MNYYAFRAVVAVFFQTFVYCLEINPNQEQMVYSSNATILLTCTDDNPVEWYYPPQCVSSQSEITTNNETVNGTYISKLKIENADYLDTNYYTCRSDPSVEPVTSKEIYIYVADPDNLLAECDDLIIIGVREFGDTVIPCRPTSPEVNVTLFNDAEEEITHLPYDPKIGYTMTSSKVSDTGGFKCIGASNISNEYKSNIIEIQMPYSHSDESAKPYISTSDTNHPVEGSTIVLNCSVTAKIGVTFVMNWIFPNDNAKNKSIESNQNIIELDDVSGMRKTNYKILTIPNATKDDQGNYTCEILDLTNRQESAVHLVKVLKKNETFLRMGLADTNELTRKAGDLHAQWIVNITAHPRPIVTCVTPGSKTVETSSSTNEKYRLSFDGRLVKFVISNIGINDSGRYKLIATNINHTKHIDLILYVQDKPRAEIKNKQLYYNFGEDHKIECDVTGYPIPNVMWYSKACNKYPSCEGNKFRQITESDVLENDFSYSRKSTLTFFANDSVILLCDANNEFGYSNFSLTFLVSEIPHGLSWTVNSSEITIGDDISINCMVTKYSYDNSIKWFINDTIWNHLVPVNHTDEIHLKNETTRFSYSSTLNIMNIKKSNAGQYICQVTPIKEGSVNKSIYIEVKDVAQPVIIRTNLNNSIMKVKSDVSLNMECFVNGVPKPSVNWLKDGKPFNNSRIRLQNDNQKLIFSHISIYDDGKYTCIATNKGGSNYVFTTLQILDKLEEKEHWKFTAICLILLFVFIMCIICLLFKTRKERKLRKKLMEDGLLNFEEGAITSFNPDINLEDQADLLPYDRRWEFPREKLKLGKQLGSGAFGVVLKAEADGIIDLNTSTTVAVKMVKKGVDPLYIKALASELKIMIHLGRHLNVVNLLGACTRNINKRELIVIVEYCKYGNIHDFILKQRNNFINQIDESTGQLDFSITDTDKKNSQNYTTINGSVTSNSNSESIATEETLIGSDGYLINKDVEPDWRSNYRGDYRNTIITPVKTSDLVCWSFQIARGMEYLASRKVLHGDLAARNILLADENIIKICDFGLAKSMYSSENYKRRKHELLPVKWMAVESIRDRVFSIQSDVWSFGITMWELFSLSVTPYPGVEHLETLYNKLELGYRLEKPKYATKEIHDIMLDCWDARPTLRPTFTELSERLGLLLESNVRSHYTSLNEMYVQMNANMNTSVDYLALLNPPLYTIREESRYVNVPSRDSPDPEEDVELKPMLLTRGNDYLGPKPISFSNHSYMEVNTTEKLTYVNVK